MRIKFLRKETKRQCICRYCGKKLMYEESDVFCVHISFSNVFKSINKYIMCPYCEMETLIEVRRDETDD